MTAPCKNPHETTSSEKLVIPESWKKRLQLESEVLPFSISDFVNALKLMSRDTGPEGTSAGLLRLRGSKSVRASELDDL